LVREFVDGTPLDRVLEKGTLPLPRACAWTAHAAEALEAAHNRGVIHGDVKPANILITADGKVKLTDFGMARVAKRDSGDSPLLGTPAYWCPEQIMGRPQDARSDIFSLGVVLYEMVTGTRPFEADSLQGICNRVLSSAVTAASHLQASVPAGFDEIIASCLTKDPDARMASGELLAQILYPLARRKVVVPTIKPRRIHAARRFMVASLSITHHPATWFFRRRNFLKRPRLSTRSAKGSRNRGPGKTFTVLRSSGLLGLQSHSAASFIL
jgi:serine/threonine protein kinase